MPAAVRALLVVALLVPLASPAPSAPAPDALETGAPEPPAADAAGIWIWSGGDLAAAIRVLEEAGVQWHAYRHLEMAAFDAPATDARVAALAAHLVAAAGGRVTPNEWSDLHLDRTVAYIEADRVKQVVGVRRDGPTVLVVDTGIDSSHPDFRSGQNLAANVQAERSGGLVTGVLQDAPVIDVGGHGTHVAGIAGGLGTALGPNDPDYGRYAGVYANGRIAGFQAASLPDGDEVKVDTVAALEAFDWALANRARYDLKVVTNSWGTAGPFSPDHPVNEASLRLYLNGMVVVFSAGNDGATGTLNKYCMAPWVLCVAAGDLAGGRASFSSTGDAAGAPYQHPDLTAPGAAVHSANPPTQTGGLGLPGELYRIRSGTSMAAPHVAGTAALVLAANPDLSPDQVMDVLVATTDAMLEPTHEVGSGYLNAREAYNLAVGTQGNREAFLAGAQVKYAGAASGDPDLARDPVSVGYNSAFQAGPVLAPAAGQPWVAASPVMFFVLLAVAIISVAAGIRWRS